MKRGGWFQPIGMRMRDFGRGMMRQYVVSQRFPLLSQTPPAWKVDAETPLIWEETLPFDNEAPPAPDFPHEPLPQISEQLPSVPAKSIPSQPATVQRDTQQSAPKPQPKNSPKYPASLLNLMDRDLQRDSERQRIRKERIEKFNAQVTDADPEKAADLNRRRGKMSVDYLDTKPLRHGEEPVQRKRESPDSGESPTPDTAPDGDSSEEGDSPIQPGYAPIVDAEVPYEDSVATEAISPLADPAIEQVHSELSARADSAASEVDAGIPDDFGRASVEQPIAQRETLPHFDTVVSTELGGDSDRMPPSLQDTLVKELDDGFERIIPLPPSIQQPTVDGSSNIEVERIVPKLDVLEQKAVPQSDPLQTFGSAQSIEVSESPSTIMRQPASSPDSPPIALSDTFHSQTRVETETTGSRAVTASPASTAAPSQRSTAPENVKSDADAPAVDLDTPEPETASQSVTVPTVDAPVFGESAQPTPTIMREAETLPFGESAQPPLVEVTPETSSTNNTSVETEKTGSRAATVPLDSMAAPSQRSTAPESVKSDADVPAVDLDTVEPEAIWQSVNVPTVDAPAFGESAQPAPAIMREAEILPFGKSAQPLLVETRSDTSLTNDTYVETETTGSMAAIAPTVSAEAPSQRVAALESVNGGADVPTVDLDTPEPETVSQSATVPTVDAPAFGKSAQPVPTIMREAETTPFGKSEQPAQAENSPETSSTNDTYVETKTTGSKAVTAPTASAEAPSQRVAALESVNGGADVPTVDLDTPEPETVSQSATVPTVDAPAFGESAQPVPTIMREAETTPFGKSEQPAQAENSPETSSTNDTYVETKTTGSKAVTAPTASAEAPSQRVAALESVNGGADVPTVDLDTPETVSGSESVDVPTVDAPAFGESAQPISRIMREAETSPEALPSGEATQPVPVETTPDTSLTNDTSVEIETPGSMAAIAPTISEEAPSQRVAALESVNGGADVPTVDLDTPESETISESVDVPTLDARVSNGSAQPTPTIMREAETTPFGKSEQPAQAENSPETSSTNDTYVETETTGSKAVTAPTASAEAPSQRVAALESVNGGADVPTVDLDTPETVSGSESVDVPTLDARVSNESAQPAPTIMREPETSPEALPSGEATQPLLVETTPDSSLTNDTSVEIETTGSMAAIAPTVSAEAPSQRVAASESQNTNADIFIPDVDTAEQEVTWQSVDVPTVDAPAFGESAQPTSMLMREAETAPFGESAQPVLVENSPEISSTSDRSNETEVAGSVAATAPTVSAEAPSQRVAAPESQNINADAPRLDLDTPEPETIAQSVTVPTVDAPVSNESAQPAPTIMRALETTPETSPTNDTSVEIKATGSVVETAATTLAPPSQRSTIPESVNSRADVPKTALDIPEPETASQSVVEPTLDAPAFDELVQSPPTIMRKGETMPDVSPSSEAIQPALMDTSSTNNTSIEIGTTGSVSAIAPTASAAAPSQRSTAPKSVNGAAVVPKADALIFEESAQSALTIMREVETAPFGESAQPALVETTPEISPISNTSIEIETPGSIVETAMIASAAAPTHEAAATETGDAEADISPSADVLEYETASQREMAQTTDILPFIETSSPSVMREIAPPAATSESVFPRDKYENGSLTQDRSAPEQDIDALSKGDVLPASNQIDVFQALSAGMAARSQESIESTRSAETNYGDGESDLSNLASYFSSPQAADLYSAMLATGMVLQPGSDSSKQSPSTGSGAHVSPPGITNEVLPVLQRTPSSEISREISNAFEPDEAEKSSDVAVQVDIEMLARDVYRHLKDRLRIEAERGHAKF